MKKLLNTLIIATLATTTTTTIIACSKKEKENIINQKKEEIEAKLVDEFEIYDKNRTLGDKTRQKQDGQPLLSYWLANDIFDWEIEKDADVKYNKGTVELKERKYVLENTRPGQREGVEYATLPIANRTTSEWRVQGRYGQFDNYQVHYAQYSDIIIAWAGSFNEGIIVTPGAEMIDAAHTNGNKIFGNIFLDTHNGLTQEAMEDFFTITDDDGYLKSVKKLIQIADTYGFDGWFINNETYNLYPNVDKQVWEWMAQFQELKEKLASRKLEIMSYKNVRGFDTGDVRQQFQQVRIDEDGNLKSVKISDYYMNCFGNDMYGDTIDKKFNSDDIWQTVTDYYTGDVLGSMTYKEVLKDRKQNQVFNSVNVGEDKGKPKYSTDKDQYKIMSGSKSPGSLAAFGTGNTWKDWALDDAKYAGLGGIENAKLVNKLVMEYDARMHIDVDNLSADVNSPDQLKWNLYELSKDENNFTAISSLIKEKTPIISDKFSTNFNFGNGIGWYKNGEQISERIWNHRGLTDVNPTYRWWVEQENNKLKPELDYDDVWYGGSSLKIKGTASTSETSKWKIYGSDMKVEDQTISMIIKNKDNKANIQFKLDYANKGETTTTEALVTPTTKELENGWIELSAPIKHGSFEKLKGFGLALKGTEDNSEIDVNLGNITISDDKNRKLNELGTLSIEALLDPMGEKNYNARIAWTGTNADLYEIYVDDKWVGSTKTAAYFAEGFEINIPNKFNLCINSVNLNNQSKNSKTCASVKIV